MSNSAALSLLLFLVSHAASETHLWVPESRFSMPRSSPSAAPQGGPDGFGYYWESTQDPGDTITFFWLDPVSHAPLVDWFPNPDDGWVRISLPFRFPFYGDTLDTVVVCSNGFLEFPVTYTTYENRSLPVPEFPFLLALFWDDLNTETGSVRRYDDPVQRFTCISWLNVVRFNTAETLSAQILLYENGHIRMNILRAPRTGNSCTIGIQGNSGNDGHYLEYVHNGSPRQHDPEDSTSIRFYVRRLAHDVGVFSPGTPSEWIPAGSQIPVTGVFKNYGLNAETFPVSCRIVRARVPRDTVFNRTGNVSALEPGDTTECYFGDWLVPVGPDSWHVLLETYLARDMRHDNDTGRFPATSFPPPYGAILGSWDFPELGDGMNLAGVTYCASNNRFYIVANRPNRIYSFPACSIQPVLLMEPFRLVDFFGGDMVWGIAWDCTQSKTAGPPADSGFWVGHLPPHGPGTILARYSEDGSFSGDTWRLQETSPDAWFAGLDRSSAGTLFAVEVGNGNRILELDPAQRRLVRTVTGSTASYRACSYLGDHRSYLFTGGWNQGTLDELDLQGRTVRTSPLADLADLDIYCPEQPSSDSFVFAYATTSTHANTIHRISIGRTWNAVGIGQVARPRGTTGSVLLYPTILGPDQNIAISGLPAGAELKLWDISGRLIRTLTNGRHPSALGSIQPGVYILTATGQTAILCWKLVKTR